MKAQAEAGSSERVAARRRRRRRRCRAASMQALVRRLHPSAHWAALPTPSAARTG